MFPHEIIFLWYSTFRIIETENTVIKNEYCYGVFYAQLLFESLLDRGYYRISNAVDLYDIVHRFKNNELGKILKKKYKQIPAKKDEKIALLQSLTVQELEELISQKFYLLTQKGLDAIRDNKQIIEDRWIIWSERFNQEETYSITITSINKATLVLRNNKFFLRFSGSMIEAQCIDKFVFSRVVDIDVFFEDQIIEQIKCSKIILLDNKTVLIVYKKSAKEYQSYVIDTNGLRYVETTTTDPTNLTPNTYERIKKLDKQYGYQIEYQPVFVTRGIITLFFSINSPLALSLFNSKPVGTTVQVIDTHINRDSSFNVCITTSADNQYALSLIDYLLKKGYIAEPKTFGLKLSSVIHIFFEYEINDNKTYNMLLEKKLRESFDTSNYSLDIIVKELINRFQTAESFVEYMCSFFPYRYLRESFKNTLKKYNSDFNMYFDRDIDYNNACLKWKRELNKLIQDLYLSGNIEPKWKNEFLLFELFSDCFEDVIFQYRADWLGSQSIDIFIPSKKTAIEYQGRQHYNPVDYFGGEEQYNKQQILDLKKKELCEKQDIKLLYWSYETPVTIENFNIFLKEFF